MNETSRSLRAMLRWAIPLLLTLLWTGFIFSNSLKNGVESGEQSKDLLAHVQVVFPRLTEQALRTMAHFGEFAILSLLFCVDLLALGFISWKASHLSLLARLLIVLPAGFLVALTDECLQLFSEGRAFQLSDILIDTLGVIGGALLFFLMAFLRHVLSKK